MSVALSLLTVLDDTGSSSVHSIPATVPGGTTQLIVHAHTSSNKTVLGVTFGASDLTLIGATNLTNSFEAEAWALASPTASTDTVTVTWSGSITGSVVEVAAASGSATVNSFGTWVAMPSSATQVVVQSDIGELPVVIVEAQNGSTNAITDTSSPALTVIDTRKPSATGFQITGLFTGVGASLVTCTFTIANAGGTKMLAGYSIRPAPVGGVISPYWLLRKRWDDAAMTT